MKINFRILLAVMSIAVSAEASAGGLLTNTNQSASFLRQRWYASALLQTDMTDI